MQLSTITKAFVIIALGVSTTVAGPILPNTDDEPAYTCDKTDQKFASKAKGSGFSHRNAYGVATANVYIASEKPRLKQPPSFGVCRKQGCQRCRAYEAQSMAGRAALERQIRDEQDEQPRKIRPWWNFWHKGPADPADPDEHFTISHGDCSVLHAMNMK
ncbi:hypothetical protein PspLS_01640 [Pyricularia sp. CBS 133598]|nr:hypothetical protein PspLS_01640 [Pyricularia sp. CBS 133598]